MKLSAFFIFLSLLVPALAAPTIFEPGDPATHCFKKRTSVAGIAARTPKPLVPATSDDPDPPNTQPDPEDPDDDPVFEPIPAPDPDPPVMQLPDPDPGFPPEEPGEITC
ncbi:hypothetical protein GGX14DRAFT_553357 [Mycena pura]|uniref:Uncharacterized protein n=1 Tax=Mycena pura TaxID=153505 RepID=A0AAD6YUN6_9AGAR|nr:hypothetical protein GGX14DRAFT_553357 [Mycena pura]